MKLIKNLWIVLFVELTFLSPVHSYELPQPVSPEDISKILKNEFRFVDDEKLFGRSDYWQSPEEFWNRKAGDCEDYALFAQQALTHLGFEAYVISIYGEGGYAHTIAVFKQNGKFNVVNEDRLLNFQADSLEEALTQVFHQWTWASIAERREGRGWPIRILSNTAARDERPLTPLPL